MTKKILQTNHKHIYVYLQVDEFAMNGVVDDTYQRPSAYSSAVPLYIPSSENTRNPSN